MVMYWHGFYIVLYRGAANNVGAKNLNIWELLSLNAGAEQALPRTRR